MQLHESVKEILNEQCRQKNKQILREAFQYDVRRLEEARQQDSYLITEGILSEEELDENILEAGKADNKAELARLQKKIAAVKATVAKSAKAGTAKAGKAPSKAAPKGKAAGKKAAAAPADKAVAAKAMEDVFLQMQKNDPKNFQKLLAVKDDPTKVAALLNNPKIKAEQDKVEDQLANSPDAQKSPGILGKVKGLWSKTKEIAKKHPIMFWGGLGLVAAVGGAAVLGAGGVGLLAASVLGKIAAAKGTIATAGLLGGGLEGAKEVMAQRKAGGKMQWGKLAKAVGTGALKRAGQTIAAIGGSEVLGQAGKGIGKIAGGLSGASAAAPATSTNTARPSTNIDVTDYDANGAADSFMNRLKGGSGSMGGALDANSLVNDKTFKGLTGGFGNSAGVNQHYAEKAKDIAQMWTQAWQQGKINDAQLKGHLVDVFAGRFK